MPVKILKRKPKASTPVKTNVKAASKAVNPKPQTKQKTDTAKKPFYDNVVPFQYRGAFFSGR